MDVYRGNVCGNRNEDAEVKKMRTLNWLDWTAFVLVIVGALNWGLVGLFDYNLVTVMFGVGTVSNVIFTIVGLAGLYTIYSLYKAGQAISAPAEEHLRKVA